MIEFTAAGIPDFRSPTSGLYSKLQGFDLPSPEAIFQIDYFKKHPEPFFALAKELYPKSYQPTTCHYLIRLLHEKGLLLRHVHNSFQKENISIYQILIISTLKMWMV